MLFSLIAIIQLALIVTKLFSWITLSWLLVFVPAYVVVVVILFAILVATLTLLNQLNDYYAVKAEYVYKKLENGSADKVADEVNNTLDKLFTDEMNKLK